MNLDTELALSFKKVFPEYAEKMEAAKEPEEAWRAYQEIMKDARQKYAQALRDKGYEVAEDSTYEPIMLRTELYHALINASGEDIKREILSIMHKLETLKLYDKDAEVLAAQMYAALIAAITVFQIPIISAFLLDGMAEDVAMLESVIACGLGPIIAAAVVIVTLILIPIIYLMQKPAIGVVLLINELQEDVLYKGSHFAHGDVALITKKIPKRIQFAKKDYVSAGFYTGSKLEWALIGAQGAFTVEGEKKTKFTFGFDCPLTSISVDNNCYCAIDETAEKVAEVTDEKNVQEWRDEKNGYGISMKCNSKSGSVAYYITRIYQK